MRLAPLAIAIALFATIAVGCVRTVSLTGDAGEVPPDGIQPLSDAFKPLPDAFLDPDGGPFTPDAPDVDASFPDAAVD